MKAQRWITRVEKICQLSKNLLAWQRVALHYSVGLVIPLWVAGN